MYENNHILKKKKKKQSWRGKKAALNIIKYHNYYNFHVLCFILSNTSCTHFRH